MIPIIKYIVYFFSELTPEQQSCSNAVVIFTVKDEDFMGFRNEYAADCFITFQEIMKPNSEQQISLKLSRPISLGLYFVIFIY